MSNGWEDQIQIRIDTLFEELDDSINDSGTETLVIGMNQRPYLFIDSDQAHELSLSQLRKVPQFLSDLVIRSKTNPVTLDFHLYWGWTAACMSHLIREDDGFREVIQDFYSMVHLQLFPIRHTSMDQRISQFFSSMNPSTMGIISTGMSFAATTGFSILEGLLRRHLPQASLKGRLVTNPIENPTWRNTPIETGHRLTYYDMLQIWRTETASETVADTLDTINDLARYDDAILSRKLAGVEESLEQRRRTDFLSIISDQRNANIHGELSTQVIGSIVLTLSCLVLWDHVGEDEFDENKEEVLNRIGRRNQSPMSAMSGSHPMWPDAFYPV